jgi:hypothetical protein
MNKLKRVKPINGKPDNRFLERDDLERELVRQDKQTLITDCLKIFDTNTMLFEQVEALKASLDHSVKNTFDREDEINRLKARTLWQVLNERIAWRIEKMKKRRGQTNYPTP